MNNEFQKQNSENEEHLDKVVIERLRNIRKEIRVPRDAFERAMFEIERPKTAKPSPFYIPTFIKISVPALALILIVGFSTQNTIESPASEQIILNKFPSENVEEDIAVIENSNDAMLAQESAPAEGIALMKSSAPTAATEETLAPNFEEFINSEFTTYRDASDTKYASYDESEMTNFVNYYEENF